MHEVLKRSITTLFNHKLKLNFFVKIINKLYEILTNSLNIYSYYNCISKMCKITGLLETL